MMNDRELLELAAKAAGYDVMRTITGRMVINSSVWNPLTDDGDAFRLQVDLGILIRRTIGMVTADYPFFDPYTFNEYKVICQTVLDDYCLAARYAIVRAAAEMADQPLPGK